MPPPGVRVAIQIGRLRPRSRGFREPMVIWHGFGLHWFVFDGPLRRDLSGRLDGRYIAPVDTFRRIGDMGERRAPVAQTVLHRQNRLNEQAPWILEEGSVGTDQLGIWREVVATGRWWKCLKRGNSRSCPDRLTGASRCSADLLLIRVGRRRRVDVISEKTLVVTLSMVGCPQDSFAAHPRRRRDDRWMKAQTRMSILSALRWMIARHSIVSALM